MFNNDLEMYDGIFSLLIFSSILRYFVLFPLKVAIVFYVYFSQQSSAGTAISYSHARSLLLKEHPIITDIYYVHTIF